MVIPTQTTMSQEATPQESLKPQKNPYSLDEDYTLMALDLYLAEIQSKEQE